MTLTVTKLKGNLFVVLVACALVATFPARGSAFIPGAGDPAVKAEEPAGDEIIVKFKKGTTAQGMVSAHGKFQARSHAKIEALDAEVVKLPAKKSLQELQAIVENYKKDPSVEFAEVNGFMAVQQEPKPPTEDDLQIEEGPPKGEPEGAVATRAVPGLTAEMPGIAAIGSVPDDPQYNNLWGIKKIYANYAWRTQVGTGRVLVAVVDTGVDYTHEDLAGTVFNGYDYYNNDADARDDHGHGTHVAGTIAGTINNNKGVVGVAPNVHILAVKVCSAYGQCPYAAIANGVIYAANRGAKVINLSLGGSASYIVKYAVDYAWSKGALLACAAGNNSNASTAQPPIYPAAYPSCLAVGATDQNDQRAYFSNRAPEGVAAPGVSILSSLPANRYAAWSGTSMATPHVAGLAALLFSQDFWHRTNSRVRYILTVTTRDIGAAGKDIIFGYGRIDAWKAVNYSAP